MEELRTRLGELGLRNVRSYIQSGNLIFENETLKESDLSLLIRDKIAGCFGCNVPVLVLPAVKLQIINEANPFLTESGILTDKLHVTLLHGIPDKEFLSRIAEQSDATDRFMIRDDVIYLYCPGGYGNTRFSNGFFESRLKCTATTRNRKTMLKLEEMAGRPE